MTVVSLGSKNFLNSFLATFVVCNGCQAVNIDYHIRTVTPMPKPTLEPVAWFFIPV
jgi:hypothetical protein